MVKQFLKDSFRNGNRFTNIGISVIMILLSIIGFLLKEVYSDFKEIKYTIHTHDIQIKVLEANLKYLETRE